MGLRGLCRLASDCWCVYREVRARDRDQGPRIRDQGSGIRNRIRGQGQGQDQGSGIRGPGQGQDGGGQADGAGVLAPGLRYAFTTKLSCQGAMTTVAEL